jgi:hypothetical protein
MLRQSARDEFGTQAAVETAMRSIRFVLGLSAVTALSVGAIAQPIGWGPPPPGYANGRGADPRDGALNVATYVASGQDVRALGHGGIVVAQAPGTMAAGLESATYEAAVVDQLAKAGYDTNRAASAQGQIAELVITHDVVQPEEPPRNPVSGEGTVGISNRGSYVGMAVDIDVSKPLKALVATRLDARIRDKATNALLWEGHAEIITREGNHHWTAQAIADRLAAALFRNFPKPS